MKIIICSDHLIHGGVSTVVQALAIGFKNNGHNPKLFLTHKKSKVVNNNLQNISVHSLDYNFILRLLTFPQLISIYKYIKQENPDFIITNKDHVGFLFAILKHFNLIKIPVLHNPHTTVSIVYKNSKRPSQKIRMVLSKFIFKSFTIVINVSKEAAKDTKNFYNLKNVPVIYNAIVKANDFNNSYKNPFDYKEGKNILACGRLSHEKNYILMLNSFAIALEKNPHMHLTILGDGVEFNNLVKHRDFLNLQSNVTFKGKVSNVFAFMQHADILWLTSLYEGLPTVIVEALSQGCPIVSTDCPYGPAEILENGKYGRLVKSFCSKDNADALEKSLGEERKSKSFYQLRAMDFEINKSVQKYINLMEKYEKNID